MFDGFLDPLPRVDAQLETSFPLRSIDARHRCFVIAVGKALDR
ncbi:hypothetical protein [Longibacter sp.]